MFSLFSTFATVSSDNTFKGFEVETGIAQSINSTANVMVDIMQIVAYGLGFLGFIVAIALLVKVIFDRKKINEEVTESTINKVKFTSILLLIVNILACCYGILGIILSIIAIVNVGKAKELLLVDLEQAKAKVKLANTLNIITIALVPILMILLVAGTTVLNTIINMTMVY